MYITAKISVFFAILAVCFVIGFAVGAYCMSKANEQDKADNKNNQDEQ